MHVVQGILCTVQNMPKTTPFGDKNDVSWNEVWFQEEAEVCVPFNRSVYRPVSG